MVAQRLPFQLLLHCGVQEGITPFSWLLHFTLDQYLIMLSVKQGMLSKEASSTILSLWQDSIWDLTPVSWAFGKHSNHYTNVPVIYYS